MSAWIVGWNCFGFAATRLCNTLESVVRNKVKLIVKDCMFVFLFESSTFAVNDERRLLRYSLWSIA